MGGFLDRLMLEIPKIEERRTIETTESEKTE